MRLVNRAPRLFLGPAARGRPAAARRLPPGVPVVAAWRGAYGAPLARSSQGLHRSVAPSGMITRSSRTSASRGLSRGGGAVVMAVQGATMLMVCALKPPSQ